MRIPRIFCEQTLAPGQETVLDDRAAHYLGQVLRMKPGRELLLFNGDGQDYPATLASVEKKRLICAVDAPSTAAEPLPTLAIELGIAISKGDRLDLVIQKATELGVTAITPLITERVDVKLSGDRLQKKQQHWRQIMLSACEQSGRRRLVDISPLQPLAQWQPQSQLKLVLSPEAATPLIDSARPASVALLIGPEGGLSEAEIQRSQRDGFTGLQLGPRILRTETAPLAAISIVQHRWGDMG